MSVTLTQPAAEHIRECLDKRGKGVGLRLGVRPSGCSGMSYVVEYADGVEDVDKVFEERGVKIIVDPKSLIYLNGVQLDFVREGLNEGLKFVNPNEKGRCGCGESFTT